MPAPSLEFDLADPSRTEALGQALARTLPAGATGVISSTGGGTAAANGTVLYLQGDLGAGKTTAVRALLRALGVSGLVRSPTYTLIETYDLSGLTCVHVDLYRLQGLSEVDELGLRDLVGPRCLLMVEWPERGGGHLPPADVDLTLLYAGDGRRARLTAKSPRGVNWLQDLGRDTSLSSYVSNLT